MTVVCVMSPATNVAIDVDVVLVYAGMLSSTFCANMLMYDIICPCLVMLIYVSRRACVASCQIYVSIHLIIREFEDGPFRAVVESVCHAQGTVHV